MKSTRRPKGEGSITYLPNGKVRIRVELAPVDGKRRWLSAIADTKTKAVAKLKQLQRDKEDSILQQETQKDTIEYQAMVYIGHIEARGLSGSSIEIFKKAINSLKRNAVDVSLSKITTSHIDKMLIQWKQNNYAGNTYHNYLNALNGFFKWCIEQELIRKSPISSLHKGKNIGRGQPTVVVLSQKEHEHLKAYLSNLWREWKEKKILKYRFYPLYCLAYETGMRAGEILALTWDCLDADNNTIRVKATLARGIHEKTIVSIPKTSAGYRTIKISEKTTQLLLELKTLYTEEVPYIFPNYNSGRFYPVSTFDYTWRQIKKGADITRHLPFHWIRHTNASNMIHKNVPIAVITERLGHSSIAITYRVYGHILQECEERNIAVIEA